MRIHHRAFIAFVASSRSPNVRGCASTIPYRRQKGHVTLCPEKDGVRMFG
jgi:hypothetical protein